MKILFGLLLLALAELLLLIALGAVLGFWLTLVWIIITAALGVALLKTARPFARSTASRGTIADRILVAAAGALMILPGPLTDLFGLLLLLPPVRASILRRFSSRIVSVYRRRADPIVVDANWREVSDHDHNPDPQVRPPRH